MNSINLASTHESIKTCYNTQSLQGKTEKLLLLLAPTTSSISLFTCCRTVSDDKIYANAQNVIFTQHTTTC